MKRAEPRCRDRVCRDDGGRPTTRYTAMRRDEVGRLRRALCPTSDRSQHTLPTFAGPLVPCVPAWTCYVLLTAWEYSHRLALMRTKYLRGLPHPWCCYRISAVPGGCHSRTLFLFPSLLDSLELRLYLFIFAQVSASQTAPRSDLAAMYEKGSVGCIGEISR
jgi:hypothetical protein